MTHVYNVLLNILQVHLGDSTLVIEVERDYTVYGDELKFGGGKVMKYECMFKVIILSTS